MKAFVPSRRDLCHHMAMPRAGPAQRGEGSSARWSSIRPLWRREPPCCGSIGAPSRRARTRALPGNPTQLESALVAGWRAEARGDWSALEALDPRLAQPAPQHPLFADAVRLRVAWRLSEDGSPRAREAVALTDRLVPVTGSPGDLVLRAQAVAAAGDAAGALTTLFQALAASRPVSQDRVAARSALEVLSSLAPDVGNPAQRARLKAALRGALR